MWIGFCWSQTTYKSIIKTRGSNALPRIWDQLRFKPMFSPSLSMNACVLKTFNLKIFGLTPLHPPKLYELHKLSLSQHLMKKIPISKVLVICRQDAVGAENLKCHKRSQSTTLTRLFLFWQMTKPGEHLLAQSHQWKYLKSVKNV